MEDPRTARYPDRIKVVIQPAEASSECLSMLAVRCVVRWTMSYTNFLSAFPQKCKECAGYDEIINDTETTFAEKTQANRKKDKHMKVSWGLLGCCLAAY